MLNFFKLYTGHLKSSRKVLLIASIGLICALTIVSSTNYYFDNSKQLIINDYFSNNNGFGGQPDISFQLDSHLNAYNKSMTAIANSINQTRSKYNLNLIKTAVIYPSIEGLYTNITQTFNYNGNLKIGNQTNSENIIELNPGYTNELKQIINNNAILKGSELPKNTSGIPQVFILLTNYNYNSMGGTYNITMPTNHDILFTDLQEHNMTVQVTGIASINVKMNICPTNGPCQSNPNVNQYPLINQLIWSNSLYDLGVIVFTPSLNYFGMKAFNIEPLNTYTYFGAPSIHYTIAINFDYEKIDPYDISTMLHK